MKVNLISDDFVHSFWWFDDVSIVHWNGWGHTGLDGGDGAD